jgi:outer membrane protein assembly factor BamE
MRLLFSTSERLPAAGLLCLALAVSMAGCASRNPLMDDEPMVLKTNKDNPPELPLKLSTKTNPAAINNEPTLPVTASDTQISKPTTLRRFLGIFAPYRVDVQQGNFVTREMVDQLREGMLRPEGVTRDQVRFVLGTPLLTDVFHSNRWDYVFRLQKKNGEIISSHVTALFDGDKLQKIEGGDLPTEQEYLAFISGSTPGAKTDKK